MAETVSVPEDSLVALVESLLFVADGPVTLEQLSRALEVELPLIKQAVDALSERFGNRGLRLQWQAQRVQLVTASEAAPYIERFLGLDLASTLTTAALETLAIVAYRQPVTRAQIEGVRGVNCDSVLRTLLHRGLVEPRGRLEQAGRPILYGTTFEFLQYFGFRDLSELPAVASDAEDMDGPTDGPTEEPTGDEP
jgi:segregation and condensation protein B